MARWKAYEIDGDKHKCGEAKHVEIQAVKRPKYVES